MTKEKKAKVKQDQTLATRVRLAVLADRMEKPTKRMALWAKVGSEDERATAALNAACEALSAVRQKLAAAITACDELSEFKYDPKECRLTAKRLGRINTTSTPKAAAKPVAVGAICSIRDKARPMYEGLIAPDDFTSLTVVEVRGKHVSVTAPGGARLVLAASALSVNA